MGLSAAKSTKLSRTSVAPVSASTYVATPNGIRVSISWVSHAGRTPCRGVGTATSEAVCGPVNPRIVIRVESPRRWKPEISAAETLFPAREPASCIARWAETVVRSLIAACGAIEDET